MKNNINNQNGRRGHSFSENTNRRAAKRRSMMTVALLLCIALFAFAMLSNTKDDSGKPLLSHDNYEYVITPGGIDEQIIEYEGMTVSFNPLLHIPNWVAWELTADEALGTEPRSNNFCVDPDIDGCPTPQDYRNSGFDRGHMAPAGDMKWSDKAMNETFFMTNICPQDGRLNRGSWKSLEEKCRQRAQRDSAIVIVCGPVPENSYDLHIGETGVAVPKSFFKVILSPYTNPPVAIGFVMPNGYVEGGMQKCAMTVDEVERITGYDFFSALPDSIENDIEAKVNFTKWSRMQ